MATYSNVLNEIRIKVYKINIKFLKQLKSVHVFWLYKTIFKPILSVIKGG